MRDRNLELTINYLKTNQNVLSLQQFSRGPLIVLSNWTAAIAPSFILNSLKWQFSFNICD